MSSPMECPNCENVRLIHFEAIIREVTVQQDDVVYFGRELPKDFPLGEGERLACIICPECNEVYTEALDEDPADFTNFDLEKNDGGVSRGHQPK